MVMNISFVISRKYKMLIILIYFTSHGHVVFVYPVLNFVRAPRVTLYGSCNVPVFKDVNVSSLNF
jgi:hypothetical protein